jgi:manganese/zinc/iron transport system permease protein
MLLLSASFGAAAAACGTLLSAGVHSDLLGFDPLAFGYSTGGLPTGPLIVLAGTTVFLVSLTFAPQRGLVARAWAALRLRRRVAHENLLRTLYELSEPRLPELPAIAPADLLRERAWTAGRLRRLLSRAERDGLVGQSSQGVRLTARGLAESAALTRRHRLWELFLIQGAQIAADHVDRDADSIEHQLPAEVINRLEAELAASGRLPRAVDELPTSPHELPSPASPGRSQP